MSLRHFCAGKFCPGLDYPASVLAHPRECVVPDRAADPAPGESFRLGVDPDRRRNHRRATDRHPGLSEELASLANRARWLQGEVDEATRAMGLVDLADDLARLSDELEGA